MATIGIGKLKFNMSGKGLAYRWGDGEVHRLFKGKKDQSGDDTYMDDVNPEGDDAYQDDYNAADEDYDAGYDDGGRDDGYDDGYGDDDGYDDGYDDADDGYDDGYDDADDGYDDGYDDADGGYDDRYDDADDRYDDGYGDGDGYDDGGYDDRYEGEGGYDDRYQDEDADGGYSDEGEYYGEQSALMRYVDENDWVTYVLLFLLPPLGIYLLWRRNRFDKPIRWAVTAVSALWFIAALVLLFSRLIGGAGDRQTQPDITMPPAEVEQTAAPAEEPGTEDITSIDLGGGAEQAVEEPAGDDAADAEGNAEQPVEEPAATALPNTGNGASADTASYVWSPASGLYYHSTDTCPRIEEGVQVWRVTREIAENSRHQSPCPDCIGGGTTVTYYGTVGGKYYHSDEKCSSMRNPLVYTKAAAENEGKTPCPVCILKTQTSLEESEDKSTALINKDTTDRSGIEVYATKNGSYFHVKSDCSGMQDAKKGSLRDALLAGKKPCPVCCSQAGTLVYCTSGGKSYHVDKNCQGMTGAKHVTLAEAMVMGKTKCEVCIKGSLADATATDATPGAAANGTTDALANVTGDDVKVFATQNGTYYHTNSTCSGMKDAQQYTLKSMLLAGKKACPVCASSADTKVYATKGGKYYHSYATCSGMTGASSGTLAEALAAGYKRCPNCWGANGKASAETQTTQKASAATPTKTTTTTTQAATASTRTPQAAASRATAGNTYVYATKAGSYYHLNSGCGGMTGASRITLKTAVKAGKKACPTCATAAKRTVYSTANGKNYHVASVCAPSGMKNGTKRTLAEALLMNQTACPYCLSSKKAATAAIAAANEAASAKSAEAAKAAQAAQNAKAKQATEAAQQAAQQAAKAAAAQKAHSTYSSGKSGVRVYATLTGKYYHTTSSCSNLTGTPSRVTLETALNYGKKACPVCASTATRTVYATRGGKYYHYSKADAGAGAKKGTLAAALAYGFDPCPNCVKRTADADTRSEPAATTANYRSGTSGIKVYATVGSKYYHAKANCSGLTGASRISLETALNYGKKACPVCLATASTKVYAVPGDKYYHYSKAHAGDGATAGTLAKARALGLKACPSCSTLSEGSNSFENGGTEDAPVSTREYAAEADTGVYIDISSANSYYHSGAKCSEAKFSGGTKVTLQYALDWDYKACPYCNPPTSAIPVVSDAET